MDGVGVVRLQTSWGPAEQDALDRCLSVPGLSARLDAGQAARRLSRVIETEIIPRLLLTHLRNPDEAAASSRLALTSADVRDFTLVVLEHEVDAALTYMERVRIAGHSVEAIFLDLLSPTARLLGDMWATDLCSFTDVTIGLSRLQQVLRDLGPTFEAEDAGRFVRGRILLATTPGEQHSFGLSMLESFFRRAGWEVCGGEALGRRDLLRLAREDKFDVIGLSLSSDVFYESIRALVPALRTASKNPSVLMMVGGRYFADHPDHAITAGADAAASDAPDALRRAEASLDVEFTRP